MTVRAADRVANAALRRARLDLGLSQSEFARAVRAAGEAMGEPNHATKRLVQKWESGEHASCRPVYRRALETVTGHSFRDLGLADDTPSLAPLVADEPRWRIAVPAAAPLENSALRLRLALEPPRRARPEEIDALYQLGVRLFGLEAVTPARVLLPMAQRLVSDAAAALAGTVAVPGRRVLTIAGVYAAVVAGRLALECGDKPGARQYLDAALTAARVADDGPLVAYVLTCAASVETESGHAESGWQLVQGALQYAGDHPLVRAFVAARAAQEAARCGDRAAALGNLETVAAMDAQMQGAAGEADSPAWARGIDRGVLAAMLARVHADLGDDEAAYEHGERAARLVTWEPVKGRALALAEAACAAARAGETAQAEAWAAEARTLAARLHCTAVLRRLLTLGPGQERAKQKDPAGRQDAHERMPVIPQPRPWDAVPAGRH